MNLYIKVSVWISGIFLTTSGLVTVVTGSMQLGSQQDSLVATLVYILLGVVVLVAMGLPLLFHAMRGCRLPEVSSKNEKDRVTEKRRRRG